MKFLLSVIAVCLVMITTKLYIPEASAEVGGMSYNELKRDPDFKEAVLFIVNRIEVGDTDPMDLRRDRGFKEAVMYLVDFNCQADGINISCDPYN